MSRAILVHSYRWALGPWLFVAPLAAQGSGASPKAARPADAIPVTSLAGQTIMVLPITMVTAESAIKQDARYARYRDRAFVLAWADSLVGAALAERGPEVQWVLPPALRHMARQSPGMVKDPDTYGQAVVRSSRYKELAEPLRGNLRNLVAVAGGRFALIPAAIAFDQPADTADGRAAVHATLTLVLVDTRAGTVIWRATPSGRGPTPEAALETALAAALPLDTPAP